MLHAARLKNRSATIEHARLLWKDGYHRKAIQTLEGAIAANEFAPDNASDGSDSVYLASNREKHQNLLAARVLFQPLLTLWNVVTNLRGSGPSFASEMDRQSRADTVRCYSTEVPRGYLPTFKVLPQYFLRPTPF